MTMLNISGKPSVKCGSTNTAEGSKPSVDFDITYEREVVLTCYKCRHEQSLGLYRPLYPGSSNLQKV